MNYESSDDLTVELRDGVLHLIFTRPEKKNALNDTMVAALIANLGTANLDEEVRAILLRAEGESFCVGSDIVARNAGHTERPRTGTIQRRLPGHANRLITLLREVQVPVVCAAQGWIVGLGLAVALGADFLIVADDAVIWAPFQARGISPDSGVSWLLPKVIGVVRAREMLLLGRKLDAPTAIDWGLAFQQAPRDQLVSSSEELANRLAAGPTVAAGLTKWLINAGADLALGEQMRNEAFGMELSSRTSDFKEGFRAFREGTTPNFTGK